MAELTGEDLSKITTVRMAGPSDFIAYTPDDDAQCRVQETPAEKGPYPNMIWVTIGGNVTVMTMKGRIETLPNVPAGQWVACPCQKIMEATAATGILIGTSAVG